MQSHLLSLLFSLLKTPPVAIGAEERNRRCGEGGSGSFNTEAQRLRGTEGMTAADLPIVSCPSHIAISDVCGVCGGEDAKAKGILV
jgi:hypothetical protein